MIFNWFRSRGVSSSMFCLAIVAAADLQGAGAGCESCDNKPGSAGGGGGGVLDLNAELTVHVLPIRLADDDGGNASNVSRSSFDAAMASASEIYQRNGTKVTFVTADEADFDGHVNSTLMNHDCKPQTTHPETYTKQDVNDDGEVDDKDSNAICDHALVTNARNTYALKWPHTLVVFMRYAKDAAIWDASAKHWTINFAAVTGGYSGRTAYHVAGVQGSGGDTFLAHEMGHYLHLAHTFGKKPTTIAEAEKMVNDYIDDENLSGDDLKKHALDLWDNDLGDDVFDTPPDPGSAIFIEAFGIACGDDQHNKVPLHLANNVTLYANPDRANVMSYFKGCPWPMHISAKGQNYRVYNALQTLNRQRLLHPELKSCYASKHLGWGVDICQSNSACTSQLATRENIIDECMATVSEQAAGATRAISFDAPADEEYPDCPVE